MSERALSRLEIIHRVSRKESKQVTAAHQLGVTTRQIRRLVKQYRQDGAKGLISKQRGQPSNRAHGEAFKGKVMRQVAEVYNDFSPILASEKLKERDGLDVNRETLRQWMMAAGYWRGKRRKALVVHQQRERRPCFGELVQIDGSPHKWFEERGPACTLIVFIDDATSRLIQLRFEPTETALGYFKATQNHIKEYGRPMAYYSDKHGIFRINHKEAQSGTGETQFKRALRELGIELICANTPQAKGRVEKANHTLQNRLVKELRLENISDIETANAFLPKFMAAYNEKFAVEPVNPTDVHRKAIPEDDTLDLIFTFQHKRTLSKNLELSYNNVLYQIQTAGQGYGLRHAKVTVCDNLQGDIQLIYKHRLLKYKIFNKNNRPTDVKDAKGLTQALDNLKVGPSTQPINKPKNDHPWRQYKQVILRKQHQAA